MSRTIVQKPEITRGDIRQGCFAILALDDARSLLHLGMSNMPHPIAVIIELIAEGPAAAPRDTDTTIRLHLRGIPRVEMELLPPDNGYCAVADINGPSRIAFTKWICQIFDCHLPLHDREMFIEEGAFGSDDPEDPGYLDATIDACINKSLLHHVRALSNHQRIPLTQVDAIRYLEV